MSLQSKCCQEPSWSEGLMVTDPSMVAHSHDNKLCWTLGSSHLFMPHELHMTIFTQFHLGLWSKREQQKLEHFLIMKYYLHNVLLATQVNLERNNTRDLTFLFWQELPIKCYCSRLHKMGMYYRQANPITLSFGECRSGYETKALSNHYSPRILLK